MRYDYTKSTWYNDQIEYLIDDEIIEYDAESAGFSIIKQFKLLPDEKIQELSKMENGIMRHIEIGKLQRDDKNFSDAFQEKFADVRRAFITENNITDDQIISVKKDAIYTIGTVRRMKFGQVEFRPKNVYSSYVRFPNNRNLELYYASDKLDVKGMSETAVNKHRIYMIQFIRDLLSLMEKRDPKVKRNMIKFVDSYKSHELEDQYYLRFDAQSSTLDPIFNFQQLLIPFIQIIQKEQL